MSKDTVIGIIMGLAYAAAIALVAWSIGMVKFAAPGSGLPMFSIAPQQIFAPRPPVVPVIEDEPAGSETV